MLPDFFRSLFSLPVLDFASSKTRRLPFTMFRVKSPRYGTRLIAMLE